MNQRVKRYGTFWMIVFVSGFYRGDVLDIKSGNYKMILYREICYVVIGSVGINES